MAGFLPKDYVWVHTRVEKFHADHDKDISIDTEFRLESGVAIFKATVKTKKWTFTWSSFWKTDKEKAFEKLETVAVGRALAFAWYEVKGWIASSEEIEEWDKKTQPTTNTTTTQTQDLWKCKDCWADNKMSKAWKPYCSATCWKN